MFTPRSLCLGLVPLALLGASVATPALAGTTVYSQPPVFPGNTAFFSWTSSNDSAYVTSDNFTLTNAANIGGLTWQGFTFDANSGSAGVEPTSFTIDFRADNGGIPGAVLDSQMVRYNESLAGTTDFFGNGQQQNFYNYSATLNTQFAAAANTPLWVSIIGNDASPNFWSWSQGTGGDNTCYQEISGGTSASLSGDRAFSLASPVPEASSLVSFGLMLALGLGGIFAARKKAKVSS